MKQLLILSIVVTLMITLPAWGGIQDGLVGHWAMDEGSGDKVADASGKGNDGTAKGTQWVNGKYGKALQFDGATSIVDIPYSVDMMPVEGATIAVWLYPTDATRSCVVGQFEAYGLALFTNLQLKSVIWGDDWVMDDITIPMKEWSHIAMTWDVANAERKIFVNGKQVAEKGDALPIPNVQNDFGIGIWIGWPAAWGDDWFMGIMDDVKLWNRALTAEEVGLAIHTTPVEPKSKLSTMWGSIKCSD